MVQSVSWKIGGEQGQGIDSTGDILAKTCNRLGYFIYGYKVFSSRIKGGHSNFKIRIGTRPIASTSASLHILVAIDQETIDKNHEELVSGSVVIADQKFEPVLPKGCPAQLLAVPLSDIAKELGGTIMRNVVAAGISAYLLGIPMDEIQHVVGARFARKGEKVQEQNRQAVARGYLYGEEHAAGQTQWRLAEGDGKHRLLMVGNEALALGAMAAGCRYMAAYPITPATDVMEWLVNRLPDVGGVVVQAEDEMAALVSCLGAGFAGARAMTATSGPGLSLMQESIGLGHMTEIPIVVVDTQRGGPSTGMPTKQEQSDLLSILYGTHGDSPRIVLAPSTIEDEFYDAMRAFNLAERYQCPVVIATDLSLSLNLQTVEALDRNRIPVDRGEVISADELSQVEAGTFTRYKITESGISPRSLPGQKNGQYLATGAEHKENGKVSESSQNRKAMVDKRFRKVEGVDLPGVHYEGSDGDLDVLVIGIGATRGPIEDACRQLTERGVRVGHAHIRLLAPFPTEVLTQHMARARQVVVVEHNAIGQLAKLVKLFAGERFHEKREWMPDVHSLTKYDGTPFLPEEIEAKLHEVTEHADGEAERVIVRAAYAS